VPHSQATEEKIHVGIVTHYFPKAKVVEIKLQSGELALGDQLLFTGRATGVAHGKIQEMQKEDKSVSKAIKLDIVTIPLEEKVRENDLVYIIRTKNEQ